MPLGFILIIAYLSIFISTHHFEAIVTIQVTALLSAVALYLAMPKLDANAETLSDRIFLFSYLMLSLIIAITIARVNKRVEPIDWLRRALGFLHIVVVPVMTAAVASTSMKRAWAEGGGCRSLSEETTFGAYPGQHFDECRDGGIA